jgi:hypothetical protein
VTNGAPDPSDADEIILRALLDLVEADEERRPGGMSVAEIARELRVSRAQVDRILVGQRFLHPAQIARASQRFYDLIQSAIGQARRAHFATAVAPTRSPESRARRLTAAIGRHNERVERFLADGVLDEAEAAELRLSYREIEAEATAGCDDAQPGVRARAGATPSVGLDVVRAPAAAPNGGSGR